MALHAFAQLKTDSRHLMKLEQAGRFWFDRKFEADVIMTDLQIDRKTGEATATYNSVEVRDHTDYGKLARFLRWILGR